MWARFIPLALATLLLGCAADVKNTATRIEEQAKFLDLHAVLTTRLDSLNSEAGVSSTNAVSRGYEDLLQEVVAAAGMAVERRYYRHQALQLLDVGYRCLGNRRAVEITLLVSRYNDMIAMRSGAVDAAGLGHYVESLETLAKLRRATAGLERDLRAYLATSDGRARLDSLVPLAKGLPDPEDGPVVDITEAQDGVGAANERASGMLADLGAAESAARAAVKASFEEQLAASFNDIVDDLNACKVLDDTGRHDEAMRRLDAVLSRGQALMEVMSSDSVAAVLSLTQAPPPFNREDVRRVVETAGENRSIARYNHAVDLYESLYRAFRNGSMAPRQVLARLDEMLALPAVEGELESQVLLLRRSVLDSLAK